jgi:WD40 repeat protein
VYSLGTVLYELLTGTTPFEPKRLRSAAFDEMLRIIREEEPPRPSLRLSTTQKLASISAQRQTDPAKLSRLVKGELDWIVMKAMEKQRSRRYESASGLAKDIERYLDGEPVTAAAPSAAYRIRKFVRRHRAALAVAATIAGLLVAGTVVSSVFAVREFRARANETAQRIRAESKEREANEERRKTQVQKAAAEAAWRDAERREYVSNMQLAFSDWERGILTRLGQTLDRTASSPDRAFEWYYWQAELHQHRRTIYPQVRFLSGVRRSSDQRDIIVHTSADLTYRLDAGTGSIVAAYGSGLVSSDGRWLADGPHTANGTTLINLTTGSRTVVHLAENQTKVALSPDGARLITLDTMDPSSLLLRVWDVATSTELDEIKPRLQARYITGVRFSPDGQWLAWEARLDNGSEVELHRVSGGEPIRSPEPLGGRFLGFTPDSSHLARWDAATRQIHLHSTRDLSDVKQLPCERAPGQIAFSPDGTHVAIITRDAILNQVVINELETGRWVSTYRLNRIGGIAFTHDSHELIVASWDGAVKFFPIESGDYIQIGSRVWNVQFNDEDAVRLLIMTDDGARLIDVDSRTVLKEYPNVGNAGIFPDGRRIATVPPYDYSDKQGSTKITIADEEGIEVDSFEYDDRVLTLLVAPDGQRIFVAAPGSTFSVLDAKTGKKILQHNVDDLQAFGFLPDGKRFVVVFEGENEFRFYDAATGLQTDSMRCEPHDARGRVQFSPDGKRLVTPYIDPENPIFGVSVYDMATKERTQRIEGHGGIVYAAYFSPDGRRLFTKSDDRTLRLWDMETGFELLSLPDGGRNGGEPKVSGRALARDGRMIAIAGPEGVFLKEAAAPEQVAAWQRPQRQPADTQWWKHLGGVQEWLVLAPIHLGEGEDFAEHLDKQQLSDEAHLDASVGELAEVNGHKLVWMRASTSDCILDFQNATSPDEDHCLAYAVTHVYSDVPRKRVRLLVGGSDLVKFYLNGKPIHGVRKARPAIPGDDEVLIDLERGKNVLVCKVIGEWRPGGVSAQIVGDDYQPIPGVTTGLEP